MGGVEKPNFLAVASTAPAEPSATTEAAAPAVLRIRDAHREVQNNRMFVRTLTGTRYERPLTPMAQGSFGEIYPARNVLTQEIIVHKDIRIQGPKRGKTTRQDLHTVCRECAFLNQVRSPMVPRGILVTPRPSVLDRLRNGAALQHAMLPQRLAESDLSKAAMALCVQPTMVQQSVGAYICAQVFSSLAAFHKAGMLHLDIKPENVVSDATGTLHLHDLGISRAKDEPVSRNLSGTAPFLAPELLEARAGRPVPYSEASDIWAATLTCLAVVAPRAWMDCQLYYIRRGGDALQAAKGFTADFGVWHEGVATRDKRVYAQYAHFTHLLGDAMAVLGSHLVQGLLPYLSAKPTERPQAAHAGRLINLTDTAHAAGVSFFKTHRPLGDAARAAFALLDQPSSHVVAAPLDAPESILQALDTAWHG